MKAKVYFTADVPAQYTAVRRYVKDIMKQYDRHGGRRFSYQLYPMSSAEQREEAAEYGVKPVQIREIRGNEFQQTRAYMSIVFLYGDRIEKIDGITTTQGLEYNATTTMLDMVESVHAFAGLDAPVKTTVFVSQNLSELSISGIGKLIPNLRGMLKQVNERTGGRLAIEVRRPEKQSRIEEIEKQYGLHTVQWESGSDQATDGEAAAMEKGVMGIVLQYRGRSQTVPIRITGSIFGYELQKMEQIKKSLEDKLSALVRTNPPVAYVTGHGEKLLRSSRRSRQRASAGAFKELVNQLYSVQKVQLSKEPIPDNVKTVIVNGPRSSFTERELYKLDQFLMRGGSLMVLADPFKTAGARARGRRPQFEAVNTGLEELLASYGVELQENYVMDTRAYVNRQQNRSDIKLHNAPLLRGDSLHGSHIITADLSQLLFLNSSALALPEKRRGDAGDIEYRRLARSSSNSWLMEEDITLNPMRIRPPGEDAERGPYTLAAVAEGHFSSHFEEAVAPVAAEGSAAPGTEERSREAEQPQAQEGNQSGAAETIEQSIPHLAESREAGKLFVAGSSELTSSQLIGNQGRRGANPNRIFMLNAVDYLNGNRQIPPMRTKGLQTHRIGETDAVERMVIRLFHTVFVPLLVIGIGIGVWLRRRRYQGSIKQMMEREAQV
jgi:ABC-type uncharacterized transport system involved in gliding motility auxiliary subunit